MSDGSEPIITNDSIFAYTAKQFTDYFHVAGKNPARTSDAIAAYMSGKYIPTDGYSFSPQLADQKEPLPQTVDSYLGEFELPSDVDITQFRSNDFGNNWGQAKEFFVDQLGPYIKRLYMSQIHGFARATVDLDSFVSKTIDFLKTMNLIQYDSYVKPGNVTGYVGWALTTNKIPLFNWNTYDASQNLDYLAYSPQAQDAMAAVDEDVVAATDIVYAMGRYNGPFMLKMQMDVLDLLKAKNIDLPNNFLDGEFGAGTKNAVHQLILSYGWDDNINDPNLDWQALWQKIAYAHADLKNIPYDQISYVPTPDDANSPDYPISPSIQSSVYRMNKIEIAQNFLIDNNFDQKPYNGKFLKSLRFPNKSWKFNDNLRVSDEIIDSYESIMETFDEIEAQ